MIRLVRRFTAISSIAIALLLATAVVATLAACDSKVDCEALVSHIAKVPLGRAPAETDQEYQRRVDTVSYGWRSACKSGKVSESNARCILAARTQDDLDACTGFGPKRQASPSPEPEPAIHTRALADLTKAVQGVAAKSGVATMHGCSESPGRLEDLFRSFDRQVKQLRTWLRDDAVRSQLEATVRDRKDAALAEALAKIETSVGSCVEAAKVVKKEIARWLTPLD